MRITLVGRSLPLLEVDKDGRVTILVGQGSEFADAFAIAIRLHAAIAREGDAVADFEVAGPSSSFNTI
jgi:hypothetical protein